MRITNSIETNCLWANRISTLSCYNDVAAGEESTHDGDFIVEDYIGSWIWPGDFGAAVSPFRYLSDRLFQISCLLYAGNRWILKPQIHNSFVHDHLNDLLLIPCALPPLLLLQRLIFLRQHDQPPTLSEVLLHLVVWSILFEALGPYVMRGVVGDFGDVVAYVIGGMLALAWWHWPRRPARRMTDEI